MAHSAVDVVVTWGEPIAYDEASDRKTVARLLEQAVRRLTVAALRGRKSPLPRAGEG
jgi:1-acyl-sn-glycerol-3-phosphate acyltransferase